jgi:allantoate deiminase
MGLRRDPGPAAAEAILAVEQICSSRRDGLVGTVGRITALPGAFNVIPGAVEFSLDIRAATSATRDAAVAEIKAEIEAIVARRGLAVVIERLQDLAESPCDVALTDRLAAAVASVGAKPRRLQSGAGHDAMTMAALCPTAMLFLRCKGGVSHNPAEAVRQDDCILAARAMLAFIDALDLDLTS